MAEITKSFKITKRILANYSGDYKKFVPSKQTEDDLKDLRAIKKVVPSGSTFTITYKKLQVDIKKKFENMEMYNSSNRMDGKFYIDVDTLLKHNYNMYEVVGFENVRTLNTNSTTYKNVDIGKIFNGVVRLYEFIISDGEERHTMFWITDGTNYYEIEEIQQSAGARKKLEGYTVAELKLRCQKRKIKVPSTARKADIIALLRRK